MMSERYDADISSKELLARAGISRATLNNYIKMGIIPRPDVRVPGSGIASAKRIGYFPLWVLERISRVGVMKREGMSMDGIREHFVEGPVAEETRDHSRVINLRERKSAVPADQIEGRRDGSPVNSKSGGDKELKLDLESIVTPAYLVNYRYEIEWVNSSAERVLFQKDISAIKDSDGRNLFRLFFDWEFQQGLTNWEEVVQFHLAFVRERHGVEYLSDIYEGVTEAQIKFLKQGFSKVQVDSEGVIRKLSLRLVPAGGQEESFSVYVSFFREGILFIFENREELLEGISDLMKSRSAVIQDLLAKRMPTLVPFCVLVADLQDSCRICAELPPEEYFEVINGMWKTLEETFKRYYGIYGKHAGDGMVYYFLKEKDSTYLVNALSCALEIKARMVEFSLQWKSRKKWFNDLYLNIGLNEGEEYFSAVRASPSLEFTALGDTINYAARVTDLARFGSVLATKNLIIKMKEADRKQFRIGLRKKSPDGDVFVENIYSRVIDLVDPDDPKCSKFMDIAALPVTEVVEKFHSAGNNHQR